MYKITSLPAALPVTVEEAKMHLRVDSTYEDSHIENLIRAATELAQYNTDRALITQTVEEYFDDLPYGRVIDLSLSPLQSVTSVSYMDTAGAYQIFSSANYTVDTKSMPPRIVLNPNTSWPSTVGDFPNAIKVVYIAGDTTTAAVPDTIKQAILLQVGFLYQNREDMAMRDYRTRSADWLLRKNRTTRI